MAAGFITHVKSIKDVDFMPPPAELRAPFLEVNIPVFYPTIYSFFKFTDIKEKVDYTYKHPLYRDIEPLIEFVNYYASFPFY